MRTTDCLINAVFVLIVFGQARERELDRRGVIIPLAIVAYVAQFYVHSIPTAGNDLVLIAAFGTVGLALGVASGFATQVRAGEKGLAVAGTDDGDRADRASLDRGQHERVRQTRSADLARELEHLGLQQAFVWSQAGVASPQRGSARSPGSLSIRALAAEGNAT